MLYGTHSFYGFAGYKISFIIITEYSQRLRLLLTVLRQRCEPNFYSWLGALCLSLL